MSRMITIRLQEDMLARVDAERKRAGLTRAAAINQALRLWVSTRSYEAAVRRDQDAYAAQPIGRDEFSRVLGAQRWPK